MRAVALASTSYYPMQMRNAVLRSPPVQVTPLHRKQGPANSLGKLALLPVELLPDIFLDMDLKSLFTCRNVSFAMRSLIDGLYQFQQLLNYAPETMASLFETGVASDYTTRHLFYLLRRPGCKICGNFGPLLFIPGRHRCCMGCLRTNIGLMPMTIAEAQQAFGLMEADLKSFNIPIVQTLKGNYGLPRNEFGPRPGRRIRKRDTLRVISRLLARRMLGSVLTPSQRKRKELYEKAALQKFREDSQMKHFPLDALASLEGSTMDHIYRFQSSTFFPYFNPASSRVEDVHACRACQTVAPTYRSDHQSDSFADLCTWIQENSAMFNEDGLLEHLRHCRHM